MFSVGNRVVYGMHGVCDILETKEQIVDRKTVTYLVLEPLGLPGTRYMVPTHNPAALGKLKRILTREQMEQLLDSPVVREDFWIREEAQRKQTYRELIGSGNREKLMGMVPTLYRHKAEQAAAGRKVHQCDENFLRDAEKLLAGEIAFVFNITQEQAKAYLRQKLQ